RPRLLAPRTFEILKFPSGNEVWLRDDSASMQFLNEPVVRLPGARAGGTSTPVLHLRRFSGNGTGLFGSYGCRNNGNIVHRAMRPAGTPEQLQRRRRRAVRLLQVGRPMAGRRSAE